MIEMVPVGRAIIGGVESAVAADDHMSAVPRIDPQRMAIRVYLPAGVALKRLAPVVGAIHRDAQDIHILFVARINANLAEIHRPRIEAVDARPGLAAISGFVNAAVLIAITALAILDIFRLTAQGSAI